MELRNNDFEIRRIEKPDMPRLIQLCEAHAKYENSTYNQVNKLERLSNFLLREDSPVKCWVVDFQGDVCGYAVISPEFSTWDAAYYYHMDCLYLSPKCRGLGIGSKMLAIIKEYALTSGVNQIQWQTPADNKSAIKFYKKNGAISKSKVRFYMNTMANKLLI